MQTGQPHPADPRVLREKAERRARLSAGAQRSVDRRKALGISGSVLRKTGG